MLFLVHQFTREFQGRADVFDGQVVLPLHLLKAHPARQTAHDDGHWCSRAADHRLAVTDVRVYDDSIVHDTHQSTRCLLSMQAHAEPLNRTTNRPRLRAQRRALVFLTVAGLAARLSSSLAQGKAAATVPVRKGRHGDK